MKFGGTSVEDSDAIKRVIEIVKSEIARKPIVVVSACAGVTNQLLKIATLSAEGKKDKANDLITTIRSRHDKLVDELISSELPKNYLKGKISVYAHELKNLSESISVLGEVTNRSRDTMASYGERLSSIIIAQAIEERSIKVQLVDAREFMITDDHYTKAVPLFEIVEEKAKGVFMPLINGSYVVVTQGFIGATGTGVMTTIGRGGSDYSAAIIGSLLNAEEIQIWTDVDGVLTADPSIIPGAHRIKKMSFDEASELAYFGARVLHPMTILPAIERNIPVYVRNSRNPSYRGTLITVEDRAEQMGLFVTNDTTKAWTGEVRWSLENLAGERLEQGSENVSTTQRWPSPRSAAWISVARSVMRTGDRLCSSPNFGRAGNCSRAAWHLCT